MATVMALFKQLRWLTTSEYDLFWTAEQMQKIRCTGETPLHMVGVHQEHHDCYAYTECVRLLRQHIDIFDPEVDAGAIAHSLSHCV